MAQFDVYVSPGRHRLTIPYGVDVQSARYAALASRLVVPLIVTVPDRGIDAGLVPDFLIDGRRLFLNPFELQAVRRALLGDPVASLASDADAIRLVAAVDAVITRAYG
ncbi:MAG: hypothetical protein BGO51_14225 [Rhodospirillales bacterium 69-11]|nr:MAG: hypothetical protein BGO51_14225 [Rhodospirillales bacterium 69-11]